MRGPREKSGKSPAVSGISLTGTGVGHCVGDSPLAMNKAELIDEVHKLLGKQVSRAASERALEAVLAGVKRGLRRDKQVSLVGFGTFASSVRPARKGFNPHTKQPMTIPAVRTVRFKPGVELRGAAS